MILTDYNHLQGLHPKKEYVLSYMHGHGHGSRKTKKKDARKGEKSMTRWFILLIAVMLFIGELIHCQTTLKLQKWWIYFINMKIL